MRAWSFIVAAALGLTSVSALSQAPTNVAHGFRAGRSGDIVVKPNQVVDDALLKLSGANLPQQVSVTQIADLLAHLMNSAPVNTAVDRSSMPSTNIFAGKKATVLVAIESLGIETLSQFEGLLQFNGKQASTFADASYPYDSISLARTVISGAYPSRHGIVSHSWLSNSDVVQAFQSSAGEPLVASLPDVMSQYFGGQSLVLSASADQQLAAALGVHSVLRSEQPLSNNHIWHYDYRVQEVMSDDRSPLMALTKGDAIKSITSNQLLGSDVSVQLGAATIQLSVGGQQAAFQIHDDIAFFVELGLMARLHQQLEAFSSLVSDEFPDYIAVGVHSLRSVKDKYGADSAQFRVAVRVADIAVHRFLAQVSQLYSSEAIVGLLFLGSNDEQLSSTTQSAIYREMEEAKVEGVVLNSQIFLSGAYSAQSCEQLKASLPERAGLDVYCVGQSRLLARELLGNASYDSDDLTSFHASLWVTILLAIAVVLIVYFTDSVANQNSIVMVAPSSKRT